MRAQVSRLAVWPILALVAAGLPAVVDAFGPSHPRPNIVFAMIDDWGWYEAGFRGNALAQTPFLDKMVTEDALLIERHYSFQFCSPARRSFLSGRLPPHVGQKNSADVHIDLRMQTIAEKLAAVGYATGHSGKWHAGFFSMQLTPHARGFETSLGFLCVNVSNW